jgi:hypothetical protein
MLLNYIHQIITEEPSGGKEVTSSDIQLRQKFSWVWCIKVAIPFKEGEKETTFF